MRIIAALLLTLCLTARADPAGQAQQAAAADVATTGIGLVLGAAEANPVGLVLIPLKLIAMDYAASLPDGEKQSTQHALSALWTGATSNNICIIVMIVTGGTLAPVCIAVGLAAALHTWQASGMERDFWALCAAERKTRPSLQCEFKR